MKIMMMLPVSVLPKPGEASSSYIADDGPWGLE